MHFLLNIVHAATIESSTSLDLSQYNPFGGSDLIAVLASILRLVRVIATPLAVLMILYGAFKILMAGTNPNNLKEGKQIITWAIVGYILVLAAGGITILLQNLLTPSS